MAWTRAVSGENCQDTKYIRDESDFTIHVDVYFCDRAEAGDRWFLSGLLSSKWPEEFIFLKAKEQALWQGCTAGERNFDTTLYISDSANQTGSRRCDNLRDPYLVTPSTPPIVLLTGYRLFPTTGTPDQVRGVH